VMLTQSPQRPDLWDLPRAWLYGGAALWVLAAAAPLATALVPRRGDVLPSGPQALRVALAAMFALLVFALLGTASVPGSLGLAEAHVSLLGSSAKCAAYVLVAAAIVVATGALVLRRLLPTGARWFGMALGAAGGATGGLALHFVCPLAVTAHVVIGHVGAVVLAAVAGAALFWALYDR
jgi:negative regulator of sigma F NrsF-like protein